MERPNFDEKGAESVSGQELMGFDFLTKLSSNSTSAIELDPEAEGGVAARSIGSGDVEHLNDGFQTPTSTDRKIKVIDKCPPAPRKPPPPPPSSKRKALFPADQSAIVADLSARIKEISPEKKARAFTFPATVV